MRIDRGDINDKKRYNNFVIACADSQYFDIFKYQFNKLNIPYYIDQSFNLTQTVLWKFLDNCLNFVKGDNGVFFDIVDSPILNIPCSDINTFKNFRVYQKRIR